MYKTYLITLIALVCVVVGCSDPRKEAAVGVTNQFLEHIRAGNHDKALKLMDADHRGQDVAVFKTKIDEMPALASHKSLTIDDSQSKISSLYATIKGTIADSDRGIEFTLIKERDEYRIKSVRIADDEGDFAAIF